MPITLTIQISHPDVVCGDRRTAIYNSVAQSMEALGPEWNHVETTVSNGNLVINFHRPSLDDYDTRSWYNRALAD